MKSLFKSVAIITVFSVLTRFAGFMFRIYLSRAIGPEGLGIYQVAFSVFAVLLTIVASGLPLIISKNSAKYIVKKDKAQERKTVTAGFFIALAASIFLCLLVLVLKNVLKVSFTDKRCIEILMILLPAVVFSSIYGVFRGNLWGHSNYFAVCFAEFFEQVLRIVICVIMLSQVLSSFDGAMSAAKSLTISCLFSAILVVILYFANGGRLSKCKNEYREIIKTSAPITGVRFATSMIQPIIAVLIPLRLVAAGFSSSQAISLLGIAVGMTMPFLFIPSTLVGSLSMALIPDLSMAQEAKNEKHISNRITSSISLSLFFSSFLVPLYMGAGEQIGKFFFDNAQSGILLSSAAWIMIPIGISNITSAILNALGLETKSFKNNIIGAIFLLLCIWFLPKYIGIKA
ncbi:MAG: oligosaccharide flippase family protein, partial [Clostridia bacterium]